MTATVVDRVLGACDQAVLAGAGTPLEAEAVAVRDRLSGPLRVAIAGRVKAGKSTLLNALVGERLAATDATECTRIVTTYRFAPSYAVHARRGDGTVSPVRFRLEDGALRIDPGDDPAGVEGLEVGWPCRILNSMVLIDTPGLASLDAETSRRTLDFLDADAPVAAGADAVVYLMRHLHASDAAFLGAFMDRGVTGASPVNAVAVLSRADEIGACRVDALESAARVAARYRSDPAVRSLVSAVVPVAGLLAETALTLREDEVASLRQLAAMAPQERATLLRSVDDVLDVHRSPLTAELRAALLARFGLFGLRRAVEHLADAPATSAGELSRALLALSGLPDLLHLLNHRFAGIGRLLQARTAIRSLRTLAGRLEAHSPGAARQLVRSLDEIEAAGEFGRLAAAHLAASGTAALTDDERAEADELLLAADPTAALGGLDLPAVLAGIERWRGRGGAAFADSSLGAVCDAMARQYELAYAARL